LFNIYARLYKATNYFWCLNIYIASFTDRNNLKYSHVWNLRILRDLLYNHVSTQLIRNSANICDPDPVLSNPNFLNICSIIWLVLQALYFKYSGTSVHELNSFVEAVRHPKCSLTETMCTERKLYSNWRSLADIPSLSPTVVAGLRVRCSRHRSSTETFFRKICSWTDLFVKRGVREPRFYCTCSLSNFLP
jgi:hypothetical protein